MLNVCKKIITCSIVFVMFFGLKTVIADEIFTDLSEENNDYFDAIVYLHEKGVVNGYNNGEFGVFNKINRAEFLKILIELQYPNTAFNAVVKNCFDDVGDEWFAQYVCFAKEENIIEGYENNTFQPDKPVNFVEASKILFKLYGENITTRALDFWYTPYVQFLSDVNAIAPSVNGFDHEINRSEMAEMIYRLHTKNLTLPSRKYLKNENTLSLKYIPFEDGKYIKHSYSKDSQNVYYKGKQFDVVDPKTFEVLDEDFSRDDVYVYWYREIFQDADSKTFEVLRYPYSKDKNFAYYLNRKIDGADAKTFETLDDFGAFDINEVYWYGNIVDGADKNTFESLGFDYAKDKNSVYWYNNDPENNIIIRLEGADAETFTLNLTFGEGYDAFDKSFYWSEGERVDK